MSSTPCRATLPQRRHEFTERQPRRALRLDAAIASALCTNGITHFIPEPDECHGGVGEAICKPTLEVSESSASRDF